MSESLQILVVDDNQMMVKTLQDIFRIKGYHTETAFTGPEALAKLSSRSFDCVLSDIKMPDMNGIELYRAIKAQQPDIPVVFMTAYANDALIDDGLAEGAIAVLTKPLDLNRLLDFLAQLNQQRSIVIVDDDPLFCRNLADILQEHGYKTQQITQTKDVLAQIAGEEQVVILEMKLTGQSGLDILRQIKSQYPLIPVIMVTNYADEISEALETGLNLSASCYFNKPLPMDQFLQTITKIHHQQLGRILGRAMLKKTS